MSRCDGCQGVGRCWICLGAGAVETAHGSWTPCHRCFGTGRCHLCQVIRVIDLDKEAHAKEAHAR